MPPFSGNSGRRRRGRRSGSRQPVLHDPAGIGQLAIDLLAGSRFRLGDSTQRIAATSSNVSIKSSSIPHRTWMSTIV